MDFNKLLILSLLILVKNSYAVTYPQVFSGIYPSISAAQTACNTAASAFGRICGGGVTLKVCGPADWPAIFDTLCSSTSGYKASFPGNPVNDTYPIYGFYNCTLAACSKTGQIRDQSSGKCFTPPNCSTGVCTESNNPIKNNGLPECGTREGNPINAGTGNKFQLETDYQGSGDFPLWFARAYNSDLSAFSAHFGSSSVWRHNYERSIVYTANANVVVAYRGDGKAYNFTSVGGVWLAVIDVNLKLVRTSSPNDHETAASPRQMKDAVREAAGRGRSTF